MTMFVAIPLKTCHSSVPMLITPRRLLEKVRKSSTDNRSLVSMSVELFKTCNLPKFPSSIAEEIEDKILGCYASLIVDMSYYPSHPEEKTAWRCYKRSTNRQLRDFYLTQTIRRAIMSAYGDPEPIYFSGPEHEAFEKAFIKDRISELHRGERQAERTEEVNYVIWRESLTKKYRNLYAEAVKLGEFQSDYEQRDKNLLKMSGS